MVAARHLHVRIWTVSDHLQHQPVPLVQTGLVLLPIRPRRCRLRRQGTDPVEQGWAAGACVQPVVVSVGRCVAGPAPDRHHAHDMGTGDCGDAVQSAPHLPAHFPGCAAGAVSIWRRIDDVVGGGDDLRVLPDFLCSNRQPLFPRAALSDRHLPRDASAVHRPVDVAAHRAGPAHVWRALRIECSRSLCASGLARPADLLRQAPGGAASKPGDTGHRQGRAVECPEATRPGRARPRPHAATQESRLHDGLDRALRDDADADRYAGDVGAG